MASSQQLFLCFWFLLLSSTLHIATSTQNNCPLSFCGDNVFPIKFPFQLTNRTPTNTSSRCVYPGFALLCNRVNQTILHLPDSGPFVVQNIDYSTQSLWITDPRNCFPKRLLRGLSLKNSPFVTDRLASFMFVNCSSLDATAAADYGYYQVVSCLSSKNYTVLAGPTGFYNESMLPSSCVTVSTVMIPMPWGLWSGPEVGIGLIWRRPSCGYCEELGQVCEFKSSSTGHETTCSELSSSGIARNTKYGIVLGVGVPALCCMVGFVCYLCSRIRAASQRRRVSVSSFNRPPVIVSTGLDGPTIESYPTTLLGESKRLPKPNDNTCSICLCEYQAKETLRTIPQCNHYFHADCIDEWLKMKATCPVCRNSPDGSARGTPCSTSTSSSSSRTSTSSSSIMS